MRVAVWGALFGLMMPMAAHATTVGYWDNQGDWLIMGLRNPSSFGCGMKSDRESDKEFLYFVSVGPGPLKINISINTTLANGPVEATLVFEGTEALKVKGTVSKGTAALSLRDNQGRGIRDAFAAKKPLKVTLSRTGTPPQVIDVSMADASDAVDSLGACARKMLRVDG